MKPHISLCPVFPIVIVLCLLICAPGAVEARPRAILPPTVTLLNEVGNLNRAVGDAEVAGWKRQLRRGHLPAKQAARLHLWLGEVEIAHDKEPQRALEQFRQAQRLVRRSDPVYGCAAYDRAVTLFRQGAYALAAPAFHELLQPGSRITGYPVTCAALWFRHAGACAGYHAQHEKLGITEPRQLDPLCGVASLAACLQANNRAYDRQTLLAHCRITGLGNTMQDLMAGAKQLGMSAHVVKADAEGLKALPKPLVAYVELDHFVAVTRADNEGVSYLCSYCGAWPGGRRDLTWKQWRAMDCNLYLVVTRPGSPADHALRLPEHGTRPQRLTAAAHGPRLAGYRPESAEAQRALLIHLLGNHVVLYECPPTTGCGLQPASCQCPDNTCCSSDGSGGGGLEGASFGDPVDLATGEEHYRPEADLTVYNPIGPNVIWRRRYGSLRGPLNAGGLSPYAQYAFGNGWDSDYDYQAILASGVVGLSEPGGGVFAFTVPATPTVSNPLVNCTANNAGTPMLCAYLYNSDGSLSFKFTQSDRSQWICSSKNGYALSRLADRNGNYIDFIYGTPGSSAGYQLDGINDSNGHSLLTIRHNANFNITSVSDRYGRSVYYTVQRFQNMGVGSPYPLYSDELTRVSQIVRTRTVAVPSRFTYGYIFTSNGNKTELLPALHTINVPSPTGKGTSTATINYSGFAVSSLVDANRNARTYTPIDTNDTRVTVTDRSGNVVYSYTVGFDSNVRTTYRTDGTNKTHVYQAGYLPDNAYQPATATNGNNQTTTYTYDQFGHVTSMTSPRNVTTTSTWNYTNFALGELTQTQEGSKSPTSISYYEPSGLIQTITAPTPGTSGASGGVTTLFTYDGLGNILTIARPGNDTTATITTTLNYTQDGSYSQPAAIGQPLTVADNLGHVTHFHYDSQGNRVTTIDALGNRTGYQYNLANQLTQMLAPAVGDITNQITVTRSQLTYVAASHTYNGTITLSNTGSNVIQGYLLCALTNLAPGVTLANAAGTYVNSPALLSSQVSLGAGSSTTLNVSFNAPSANAVYYGVQTYLTDGNGNPLAQRSVVQNLYLYPGGPVTATQTYDETGALYRQVNDGYGEEGELLSRSGSTEPVTYTYDAAYRLQTLADGNGNATMWTYNSAGWLANVTYPMGDGQQYPSYDPMGNLLTRIDGRGIETDYIYHDPESKLTSVQYVNSANYPNVSQYLVSIDYDDYGRTQDVYNINGHTHHDYDDLNKQTEIDTTYNDVNGHPLPTVSLIYGFNADGSRRAMNIETSTANYSFAYEYDAVGRLQSLTNPFGETSQWSYLNNNWLASQQYANGVLCLYAPNRRGFLNDLTQYGSNGSLLSDFGSMAYDAGGNRLTKVVTIPGSPSGYSGQTAYAYDIKDQLVQEQSTLLGGYTENFNYDPAGNPLSFKGQTQSFNADNQFAGTGFDYDGEGNPVTYTGTPLTYDPEDRMTSFGSVQAAGYRADGLRAWKETASMRNYFIDDGIQPILELDGSGSVAAVNTYSTNGLLSRHTGVSSTFYTFDPHGSVAHRLDASGNRLVTSIYDAFGFGASTASVSDPFGYCAQRGYYSDIETAFQLLGHRYYVPGAGRFVTRDPIRFAGGVNMYAYVNNRPVTVTDPAGNDPPTVCDYVCGGAGSVVGTIICLPFDAIGGAGLACTVAGGVAGVKFGYEICHGEPIPPGIYPNPQPGPTPNPPSAEPSGTSPNPRPGPGT